MHRFDINAKINNLLCLFGAPNNLQKVVIRFERTNYCETQTIRKNNLRSIMIIISAAAI